MGSAPARGAGARAVGAADQENQALAARVAALEDVVAQQAKLLSGAQQSLSCVQRDCRRIVVVAQYNILASYLGLNTQPWFLYGADIDPEQRRQVLAKYNERDDAGKPKNSWPAYAEGILTAEQIEEVIARDIDFSWDSRKVRLVEEIQGFDADVISLVELDTPQYFVSELGDKWDMAFHKRPRAVSQDGCGVFWRRSKFELLAEHAFDFVDGSDHSGRVKRDRGCLMVLLGWRHQAAEPLVVVSTHLARNPEDRSQTALRVRQVTQIMEALTEFTEIHDARLAPVVLCGDLNAKHFGEIRGIARTVWQVTGSKLHKFMWCATDVPTGPTSITTARQCRIDAVQYLGDQMELVEVRPTPRLPQGQVIPNGEHPSDHFPVVVRFRLKDSYQVQREVARAWLECVAAQEKVHPLTKEELRSAFEFFDRDRSEFIHRQDLEEVCHEFQCGFSVNLQDLLLDCFPDHQISFHNFIKAYEVRLAEGRIRSIGELEYAFEYLADGNNEVPLSKLEAAFREITPISFSDEEVSNMLQHLHLPEKGGMVTLRSFCEAVCQASFPHRDRRRFSCVDAGAGSTGASWAGQASRASTKEMQVRLGRMQDNMSRSHSAYRSNSGLFGCAPVAQVDEERERGEDKKEDAMVVGVSQTSTRASSGCVSGN